MKSQEKRTAEAQRKKCIGIECGFDSLLLTLCSLCLCGSFVFVCADDKEPVPILKKRGPDEKGSGWLPSLAEGKTQAQKLKQPIFLRAVGAGCPWCKKLEEELVSSRLKDELAKWTLVAIDVDLAEKDAESLSVGPIPALRLLSPAGRVVASMDGYRSVDKLLSWLRENYSAASGVAADELIAESAPIAESLPKLVAALGHRDPSLREAAMRRLLPHTATAAKPVAEAFAAGPLQKRLAALELLRDWGAPMEKLDPWRPETLTDANLKLLRDWAANPPAATAAPATLTPERLAAARADLERLIQVPDLEAAAVRERLARYGPALLPEVYARLKQPPTDQARERLTALRYRLVARDSLALNWPGGIDRLASADPALRRQAVQELVKVATAPDEALLLELFSSPDALVREMSLRALSANAGANAAGALTRLLEDPEPNVRAAVLKQLAEKPAAGMVPKIAAFAASEADADLVVHAVRVLREAGGKEAGDALIKLLKHASWRVRAEAAQAVGEVITKYTTDRSADLTESGWKALVESLKDADGFVVSRAVEALQKGDRADAVEPLVAVVAAHPDLASEVIKALAAGNNTRGAGRPHLLQFRSHAQPAARAAAILQLVRLADQSVAETLIDGLKDKHSDVRTAAAEGAFEVLNGLRGQHHSPDIEIPEPPESGIVGSFQKLFSGRPKPGAAGTGPAGVQLPAWAEKAAQLLPPYLTAPVPHERVAGALTLIALGKSDGALPVLYDTVKAAAAHRGKASGALAWLPWPKRVEFYGQLLAFDPDPDQLRGIALGLAAGRDRNALPILWELAGRNGLSAEHAASVYQGLSQILFGSAYYSRTAAGNRPNASRPAQSIVPDVKPRAESGPEMQRVLALMLLFQADATVAGEVAAAIVAERNAPGLLRRDAFQILLLTKPRADIRAAAIEAIGHSDPGVRHVAAMMLAGREASWLRELRAEHLSLGADEPLAPQAVANQNRPFVASPIDGLKAESVRPLVNDADPATAAAAGYLLAQLGDAAGFDRLVHYWREFAPHDAFWCRLVARAVTALDDDERVLVLEEMYRGLNERGFTPREFYWSMRALQGPNALRLRKLVRAEVGMNALRESP